MRPITSLTKGLAVTAALILALGFGASKMPVSHASTPDAKATATNGASGSGATKEGLAVAITQVRAAPGKLMIFVFDDQSAFDDGDYYSAAGYAEVAADTASLTVSFPELSSGPYAVSLFHDENSDGDFNMSGIYPLEGYGTSGARSRYDEPSFRRAATDARKIPVRMYYP